MENKSIHQLSINPLILSKYTSELNDGINQKDSFNPKTVKYTLFLVVHKLFSEADHTIDKS